MDNKSPLKVTGGHNLPDNRNVLWKNICFIGIEKIECLIEFSYIKLKFYIVAFEI